MSFRRPKNKKREQLKKKLKPNPFFPPKRFVLELKTNRRKRKSDWPDETNNELRHPQIFAMIHTNSRTVKPKTEKIKAGKVKTGINICSVGRIKGSRRFRSFHP